MTVSEDEQTFNEESDVQYSVRIMIINPKKKSEYVMVKAVKSPTGAINFGVVK